MLKRQRLEFDAEYFTPGYVAHFDFILGAQKMAAMGAKDATTYEVLSELDHEAQSGIEGKVVAAERVSTLAGETSVFTVEYYPRCAINYNRTNGVNLEQGIPHPNQLQPIYFDHVVATPVGEILNPVRTIKLRSPSDITRLMPIRVNEEDVLIGYNPYSNEDDYSFREYYCYSQLTNPELVDDDYEGDNNLPSFASDRSDDEE